MKKNIFVLLIIMAASLIHSQNYNYVEALQKALYFYDVQRSGPLPENNDIIWRADATVHDGDDVGLDLNGGWFDAGDHVKFNLPMASSALTMAWGIYEFRASFVQAGLLDKTLETIKWATDYFIKCHPSPNLYYYQIGTGSPDHVWWGPAEVLDEVMERPSYSVTPSSPGSTVVGATSAALAMASLIFQETDPDYAALCLSHAIDLHNFANSTRSDEGYTEAVGFYTSFSGFWDELSASGVLLYMITDDKDFLDTAQAASQNWDTEGYATTDWKYKWTHSWDDMHYIAQIMLARITGEPIYIQSIERNLDFWMPGGGISYSPGGLAWLDQWGSLRYAANASFLAFLWADETIGTASKKSAYRNFAEKQINYILGSNPHNRSYVIGFGQNPPINPHHRTAHGAWFDDIKAPANNRHLLFGALVGGPNASDAYADDREDYQMNEVACDYNAAFVCDLAIMAGRYGGSLLTDFPQAYFQKDKDTMPEYFARAIINSSGATSYQIVTQITNRSAWPATVKKNMTARFFFDISEVMDSGYGISDIKVSMNQSEGGKLTGPHHWDGSVHSVEIDYSGVAIYPGGRSASERVCGFEISAPSGSAWDPSNDWSFQDLGSSFTWEPIDLSGYTDHIPVYDQGELLNGLEPGQSSTPTPQATTTATPDPATPEPSLKGDANDNGSVDIVDALLVAQYYVKLIDHINVDAADVNCDTYVDIVDALLIAQFYVKLIIQFC